MAGLDLGSDWTALLAGFIVSGVGVGLLNPVIADVALSVVPKERAAWRRGSTTRSARSAIAVGIAAWGAIFLGAGASKTQEVAGGAVSGGEARGLVEATSSGRAAPGALAVPQRRRERDRNAAEQGFLHGLNEILLLGALLSFAGSVLALWLVRERDIERETLVGTDFETEVAKEPAQAGKKKKNR